MVDEIKIDIQKCRIRWFGHVMRMGEERIPKKWYTNMEGKRLRGKSRIRWIDQIRKDTEMSGEEIQSGRI